MKESTEYTFYSSVHETFSRTDYTIGHKTDVSKLKKTDIPCILADHQQVKKHQNIYTYWGAEQHFLNEQWITQEFEWKFKNS